MASLSDRVQDLEERLLATPVDVTWKTAGDLARMAMDTMGGRDGIGRHMISTGVIHLDGEGVRQASAPFEAVGDVMKHFQRLITATGAAHEGHTNLTGQFPAAVMSRTGLRLVAGPASGSVVLEFMPDRGPAEELSPDGNVPMLDEPTEQLADTAVSEALGLMAAIHEVGPDADGSVFLEGVSAHGPRVAVALRDLAKTLDLANFDTVLSWQQPGSPTVRASITREDAHRIAGIIVGKELDSEPVVLDGILRTISDLTNLVVELPSGDLQPVRGAGIPQEVMLRATLHSRVRIHANVTVERRPGGIEVAKYTASSMDILP